MTELEKPKTLEELRQRLPPYLKGRQCAGCKEWMMIELSEDGYCPTCLGWGVALARAEKAEAPK